MGGFVVWGVCGVWGVGGGGGGVLHDDDDADVTP